MLSNHLVFCRPPSPFAFDLSQYQGLLQRVSSLHQVSKVMELKVRVLKYFFVCLFWVVLDLHDWEGFSLVAVSGGYCLLQRLGSWLV